MTKHIKNIIFDLGGVIIGIHYQLTADAFKQLGAADFDKLYTQNAQAAFLDDYESGKMSSTQFRIHIKNQFGINPTDDAFDAAWNALFLDLPLKNLRLIQSLKEQGYKLFLFSNTNEIHLKKIIAICQEQTGISSFKDYFDKEYYSHLFGQKKPNPESFKAILAENGLKPEETVFIDDTLRHIEGAKTAGLYTIHLTHPFTILDVPGLIVQLDKTLSHSAKPPVLTKSGTVLKVSEVSMYRPQDETLKKQSIAMQPLSRL